MPEYVGTVIVILILVLVVTLAIRSLWKSHKKGGGCSGDCGSCGGCHKH